MLGLDFEPERLPDRMNRQVDAKLSWRRSQDPDQLWFFYYERGFAGILPVWGGYYRLFFLADDAGVPDRDPTHDELQVVAREVTGQGNRFSFLKGLLVCVGEGLRGSRD